MAKNQVLGDSSILGTVPEIQFLDIRWAGTLSELCGWRRFMGHLHFIGRGGTGTLGWNPRLLPIPHSQVMNFGSWVKGGGGFLFW